jgi:hypothetical protein
MSELVRTHCPKCGFIGEVERIEILALEHAESPLAREMMFLANELLSARDRIAELEKAQAWQDIETPPPSMNDEVIGELRKQARDTFGGNCSFADDDLRLLTVCAQWAILNGIPEEINPQIIRKAKAHLSGEKEVYARYATGAALADLADRVKDHCGSIKDESLLSEGDFPK